jgi:hypothetical protein
VRVKLDSEAAPIALVVAGVMPPDFDYPRGAEAWVPAAPLIRTYGTAWQGPDHATRYDATALAPAAAVAVSVVATHPVPEGRRTPGTRAGGPGIMERFDG